MPKSENQKSKIMAVLRILEQQTDADHLINVPQIIEQLEKQGIPCERKSVYSDIETLNSIGYDIDLRRGRGGGYRLLSRTFDLAELKLLVDAVQAGRFIPQKKSLELIKKLEGLTSMYEASSLRREVYVLGRPKSANNHLLYSIDALHEAIGSDKQVRFRYKSGGGLEVEWRTVSPWQLAWDNGYYYLIAYQDEKSPAGIRHYRVDRMQSVEVAAEQRKGKEQFEALDLPAYLKMRFNMYNGEQARVTLRCEKSLADAMRERFGSDAAFIKEDGGYFHFDADVCVSEQFFGWVCGFGGKVSITAPDNVRAQMAQMLDKLSGEYK